VQHRRLVPENDATVLFTTAGMHPLIAFLLGEPHPAGVRLVNCQKCIRTGDIDEVGDDNHLTFFEMLGNWSLGDYFKEDAIAWSFEFLTKTLEIPVDRLAVTCFEGNDDAPRDDEAAVIWKNLGIPEERIFFLPKEENWWGPAGQTGPCGPDTEMFYILDPKGCGPDCGPACSCNCYVEIGNDVLMQYNKTAQGDFAPLAKKNVDFGGGLERMATVLQGKTTVFETEIFTTAMKTLLEMINEDDDLASRRIICDHLRAATFILAEGVVPGRLDQPYILRRLIRRAIRHGRKLGIKPGFPRRIAEIYIEENKDDHIILAKNPEAILHGLDEEERRFLQTIDRGEKQLHKLLDTLKAADATVIEGKDVFDLFATFGYPPELTREMALERGYDIDMIGYEKAFEEHQAISRTGAEQKFSGGLADHTDATTKLHTATHLLHQALRQVLGDHVAQKGSNITPERLRFDFRHPEKMTKEQIAQVEQLVNEAIQNDLSVTKEECSLDDALAKGAIGLFADKYGNQVKVYSIGNFSMEVCGGPHVDSIACLGTFKIKKESSSSAGIRRIKAILED